MDVEIPTAHTLNASASSNGAPSPAPSSSAVDSLSHSGSTVGVAAGGGALDGGSGPYVGRDIIVDLLLSCRAYDVLPLSSKLLAFDVDVPLRLAYYALVEQDAVCAPLWDSLRGQLVGTLALSDMCDIMRVFHVPGTQATAAALSEFTIAAWRAFANSEEGRKRGISVSLAALEESTRDVAEPSHPQQKIPNRVPTSLISVHPEDNLLLVCKKMQKYGIHHMPVLDPEQTAVLSVLSYKSLLLYILNKYTDSRPLMSASVLSLGVGSFGTDIVVVPATASVISVLNVLAERRISGVPVVSADDSQVVVDVYGREDVAFLALDSSLMILDAPVLDVIKEEQRVMGTGSALLTCSQHDSLAHVMTLLAAANGRAERVVCVDESNRVTGIIALSDIFAYFTSGADAIDMMSPPDASGSNTVKGSFTEST